MHIICHIDCLLKFLIIYFKYTCYVYLNCVTKLYNILFPYNILFLLYNYEKRLFIFRKKILVFFTFFFLLSYSTIKQSVQAIIFFRLMYNQQKSDYFFQIMYHSVTTCD